MPIACRRIVQTYLSALVGILWLAGCSTPREVRPKTENSVSDSLEKQSEEVVEERSGGWSSQRPGELKSLSLGQARSLALVHNPWIQAAQGSTNVARAKRVQAGLWANPQFEVFSEEAPINAGGLSRAKNMIGISQKVPFPGKKQLDRELGEIGIKQSSFEYESVALQVRRDVEIAYYRVLGAEQRNSIAEELLEVAKSLSDTALKRLNAGAASAQERVRAEIEYERALAKVLDTERDVGQARQALMTVVGKPEVERLPLTDKMPVALVDRGILSKAKAVMLEKHPRLAAALAAKEGSEVAVKRAKRQRYPDVTFGIAGGREEIDGQELVEFRIALPLPFIDRGQGKIPQAIAEAGIADARLTAVEQGLLREFNELTIGYRTATQKVTAYQDRILPKTREALRMVRRGFEEGKFEFIDLLDTQRTSAESRLDYQQALLELNETQAQLKALIGE